MYQIRLDPKENLSNNPFQISVTIEPDHEQAEKELSQIFTYKYFLATYINPIFWIFNLSPMLIYIKNYPSDMDSNHQLLKLNDEMIFNFKTKSQFNFFKRIIVKKLTSFIDKKLALLEEKSKFVPQNKLLSDS